MIEAMKQMVEALEIAAEGGGVDFYAYAKEGRQAIAEASQNGLYREGYRNGYAFGEAAGKRQAIAEAEQEQGEPDKYAVDIECTKCGAQQSGILTVNTTPQQRTWVGLTGEQICDCWNLNGEQFYKNIEAKLKELNT